MWTLKTTLLQLESSMFEFVYAITDTWDSDLKVFFFLADFGELARNGKRGSLIMFVFKT